MSVEGNKITFQGEDGTETVKELMPGAYPVVEVGEVVKKDDPITTNPNVGGFGQEEKDIYIQDVNRVYAYTAIAFSIFVAQLAFVLKKKQFEKVQLPRDSERAAPSKPRVCLQRSRLLHFSQHRPPSR